MNAPDDAVRALSDHVDAARRKSDAERVSRWPAVAHAACTASSEEVAEARGGGSQRETVRGRLTSCSHSRLRICARARSCLGPEAVAVAKQSRVEGTAARQLGSRRVRSRRGAGRARRGGGGRGKRESSPLQSVQAPARLESDTASGRAEAADSPTSAARVKVSVADESLSLSAHAGCAGARTLMQCACRRTCQSTPLLARPLRDWAR